MSFSVKIGIVLLLILLNGLFAMSELAIVSARRGRLRQMAEDGHKGAKLALAMAEDPASFLSIVQTGMTLNSIFTGAFSGATLAGHFADALNRVPYVAPDGGAVSLALTVICVTYLSLVVGELVPKRIGLVYAEPIAVRTAYIMKIFAYVVAPIVWLLRHSTEKILHALRLASLRDDTVTEEEVKDLIAEGAESGAIKPAEKNMLEGVMRLADRSVRTIMTPRVDMVWLGADDSIAENYSTIRASGYSRFPVARGDLEEIMGIVHAKDMLNATLGGQTPALKVVMRPALTVPDTTTVLRLLEQFRQSKQHIAIVADEYGSVEGLVSVTDILQTITGDMPERGQDAGTPAVKREDGSWLIDGMAPIDEVEHLIGLKDMQGEGDFHTLAGFVVDRLGRLPATGDHFTWDETHFEVVDMDGRRIDKVLITPPPEDGPETSGG